MGPGPGRSRDQKIIQAKLFSNLLPKRELHLLASIFQVGKKWTHQTVVQTGTHLALQSGLWIGFE
jgi:hypothetical protein